MGRSPCLEDEGSEDSSPQVVGLSDEGGASEGMRSRAATTVRVIASRNEAAYGSKEVEFEM